MVDPESANLINQIHRLGTSLSIPQAEIPDACECFLLRSRRDGSRNCSNRIRYCFSMSNGLRRFTCGLENHKRFGLIECRNGVTANVAEYNRGEFVIAHINMRHDSDMATPVGGVGTPLEQIRMFNRAIEQLSNERRIAAESRDIARAEREALYNHMVSQSRIVSQTRGKIDSLNKIKDSLRTRMTFRLPWCPDAGKQDTMCVICHMTDMDPENSGHLLQCQHQFHTNCIQTWFKNRTTCPICRKECNVEEYYQ